MGRPQRIKLRILMLGHFLAAILLGIDIVVAGALKIDATFPQTVGFPAYESAQGVYIPPKLTVLKRSMNVRKYKTLFLNCPGYCSGNFNLWDFDGVSFFNWTNCFGVS